MSGIAIVSPGYPDRAGGVTDHTRRLVSHWVSDGPVPVYGSPDGDAAALVDDWQGAGVRALLLQYVPFLYGRRGLSSFPERLARAAGQHGLRTAVFVHEPWVPPTRLPWLILGPLQRRQLRRLMSACHRVVTAVPGWRTLLGDGAEVVAVGSTLGPPPMVLEGPLAAPLVFSPLASGLRWDWILAAAAAIGTSPRLIVIGATRDQALAHLGERYASGSWDWRGRVSAAEAMGLLSRAPLVLAPFADGMTGRRTSAMAALSAGARTVTSRGEWFDPAFEGGPAIAGSMTEFADRARSLWAEADSAGARAQRRAWHDERFDPTRLDARLRTLVEGT